MPAAKKPAAKRPAAKKPVKSPPPPPAEETVEEEERQTLQMDDDKYYVDELSEEAQDIVKILQHLNPQAEEAKRQYLIYEKE